MATKWMNAGINTTEACTLFNYTQSTICTQSSGLPTLLHVGYHAITDCIQFNTMEFVTTQSQIMLECMTVES